MTRTDSRAGAPSEEPSEGRNPGDFPLDRRALTWGVAAVVAAAVPALWLWDFTIDDALISIRYARHLATGEGYRFNLGAPCTDGVTPLPWPFLLAPLARGDALAVLFRAKCFGLVAWLVAALAWGTAIGRAEARAWVKGIALVALAVCVPVAAHAVSGMETGLAIALATWAAIERRPMRAAVIAGVVASLRPEMVVWAVTLAATRGTRLGMLAAAAPLVACSVVRQIAFGHAAPLAVMAKPSDLAHGINYAVAAALISVAPVLALSPVAFFFARGRAAGLAVAGLAHFGAIALAGGDWMPFARLAAPVAPSLLYAFVLASPRARLDATLARAVLALGVGVFAIVGPARAGRDVGASYRTLVERARPHLEGAARIASLDVGWPTAATDATIIDLAGLTDPFIAALPGGHTSKRVDPAFLLARDPDVILLYTESGVPKLDCWRDAYYGRVVDARLAASDLIAEHYEPRVFLAHGRGHAGYVVLRKKAPNAETQR